MPRVEEESVPASGEYLACVAERDLPTLLPLLPELARQ
jgi:hypothetical protein